MRYSVKENTQLQRTQNSDYVIKPSQTVNLFFQAGNHYKRRNKNSPSHKEKTMYTMDYLFCSAASQN